MIVKPNKSEKVTLASGHIVEKCEYTIDNKKYHIVPVIHSDNHISVMISHIDNKL